MRSAIERADAAAAVWVRSRTRIDLWFFRGPSTTQGPDRIVVEARPKESAELLALRAVELLRGRLLPVPREHPDQAPGEATSPPADARTRNQRTHRSPMKPPGAESVAGDATSSMAQPDAIWLLGAGPGFLVTAKFSPIPLGVVEVGWRSTSRWTVALQGAASVTSGSAPVKGTRTDATGWLVTLEPRFRVLGGKAWEIEGCLSLGWRTVELERHPEEPFAPFTESQSGPFGGVGVGAHYGVMSWLELRGAAAVVGGSSLAWTVPTGPEQSQGNGEGQSTNVGITVHAVTYALAVATF